jgi:hypothetical protein
MLPPNRNKHACANYRIIHDFVSLAVDSAATRESRGHVEWVERVEVGGGKKRAVIESADEQDGSAFISRLQGTSRNFREDSREIPRASALPTAIISVYAFPRLDAAA